MDAFYIILTGSLVAVSCSLLGAFLILRKMSMVGDAISHSVLPGIVIAFFIAGSIDSIWMLVGAGILGVFTTFLIEFFHRKGNLQTDASIGVTFTWLFALGVILVSYFASNAHIDQDCILHGEIAYVPLDLLYSTNGTPLAPKAIIILGVVLSVIIIIIGIFYKELFVTTFDPDYAKAIGLHTNTWHYLLMGLVSLTTVASFESVGAILVVAFLIAPAASAYLITTDLKFMLILGSLFGIASAFLGYWLSYYLNASIAGSMTTVSGLIFTLCYLYVQVSRKKLLG
jgi:manganese/zinc/iron transport system permease protein